MSILPAPMAAPVIAHLDHVGFGPREAPGCRVAPLRWVALVVGVLLPLVGSWPVAEAQTARVGSVGVMFASGALAPTVEDAVPGPHGAVTREPPPVEEGVKLGFALVRCAPPNDVGCVVPVVDLECTYIVSETGDMVPDGDEGAKTVTMPAHVLKFPLPRVPTVDDTVHEPDSTVSVSLPNYDQPCVPNKGASASATVLDNDTPTVSIGAPAAVAVEGEPLSFPVTLDRPGYQGVTLDYGFAGTAGVDDDYVPASDGTLTIPAGETRAAIELRTLADGLAEVDESVEVTISNIQPPRSALPGATTATGWIADNNPPAVTVADARAPEDASLVFEVTLSPASLQDVSVQYEVTEGTATENADYRGDLSGELMFAPGETAKRVELALVDDMVDEPDETVTLELTDVRGATLADGVAEGIIADNDDPPMLGVADATGPEGASLVFAVMLSGPGSRDIEFRYEVTEGTATEPDDYTLEGGRTLMIPAGETKVDIRVSAVDDDLYDPDEWFEVAIADPLPAGGATIGRAVATGTITDGDGVPTVTVADARASEDAQLVFEVTLSPASSETVSLQYTVTGGTAIENVDYGGRLSGPLTFAPGETGQRVELVLVDDAVDEPDETVTLELTDVRGATLADGVATGTIIDNDGAPAVRVADATAAEDDGRLFFAVTLSPASSQEVSLRYAITPGTAQAADYAGPTSGAVTFLPGETSRHVELALVDDTVAEEDETVTLTLSNVQGATLADGFATGTITDNDGTPAVAVADATAAEGVRLVFEVTLSLASSQEVSLQYAVTEGTATENADYGGPLSGTVTFAPGETAREIALALVDDTVAEEDETVALALSNVQGATLADGFATGTITDNDGAPAVRVADATAAEGEGRLAFAVTLSRASSREVTVEYEFAPGTATENADYGGPLSGTVTFAPGETAKEVALDLVDDAVAEEDETVTLALAAPSGATLAGAVATGTIRDDDLPRVTVAAESGEVAEGGDAAFVLTRAGATTEGLTVAFVVTGGDSVLASPPPTGATFEAGAATVRVTLATEDDGADEADATVTLTLAGGAAYEAGEPSRAAVVVRDDDPPEASVGAATAVAEGGELAFPVRLSRPVDAAVTVDYVLAGTATAGEDYEGPAAGSVTFARGETEKTILVATLDDERDEPDETVEVSLSDGDAHDLGASRATGVILDDDDPPEASVGAAAAVAEGGELAFPVRLSRPVGAAVTVDYVLAGTATAGEDYEGPAAGSVTFTPGETKKTIVVATLDDDLDESDETVEVTLAAGEAHDLGASRASGVILDDDEPPEASVGDAEAVAEGGALSFPVRLSHPSGAAVTVEYVLAGTATAGEDYEGPAAGSMTFAPGETEKMIVVATLDDDLDESDETVEVTLAAGEAHDLGASRASGVILDDDDPPLVTVSAVAGRVPEGEAAVFVLRRTGDASGALTVELAVSERGGDMVPAGSEGSRWATFAAGATTATLAVATGSDRVAGPDSEVTATLGGGDGYAVGRPDSATVTVSDGGGGSLLAEGRRLGAASLLRRHVQRFSQLTSVVALAVLEGGRPPSTVTLRADADGAVASGDFGLDLSSGWDGWGSIRYSKLTEATDGGVRDFYMGGSRLGAGGRSVYGALVGFESAPVTSRGVRLDAKHAHLGLYGARRLGGTLTLDGALGWGRGDHDLSLVGGPYPLGASHRSTRLVARGDLTGDFGWGGRGPRIEPQLGLLYAREDLGVFTDSLGGAAPGERLWLARLGFGPRLTWRRGDGATRARLRVNFDAHNLRPSGEDMEEVSAALELGHRRRLGARGSLDLSAGVDGLGSDWFSSTSFGLTYEGAF